MAGSEAESVEALDLSDEVPSDVGIEIGDEASSRWDKAKDELSSAYDWAAELWKRRHHGG